MSTENDRIKKISFLMFDVYSSPKAQQFFVKIANQM